MLALPPAFLAVAHLWGTVYHQTMMTSWGFDDSDFPLTAAQVYQKAFFAALAVVVKPFSWVMESVGMYVWLVIAALAATSMLWGWLTSKLCVVRWWRRFSNRAVARRRARRLPRFVRRSVEAFIWVGFTAAAPITLSVIFSVVAVVLVYPPMWAGAEDARDLWARQGYLAWRKVSWSDEKTGVTQTGALMRCTEKICGVLQEGGRSLLVAPAQVRYLPMDIPVARSAQVGGQRDSPSGQTPAASETQ